MNAIDRLIAVALAELGYLEKKSNKDLDSKTANAGSANYTKYNRDMKAWAGSAGINDQWCQNFVDWVFVTAFGLEKAKTLIYKFTNYTPTGSGAFKNKGRYIKRGKGKPVRGDVIYFYSSAKGRIGHVGIVTKVTSSKVYTIEGNTSGASTLVTNGGGVREKSYSLTSTYIDGYGSVDYSQIENDSYDAPTVPVEVTYKLGERILKNYTEGPDVKELQQALIDLGYSCGNYGADGEYGDCTEMAVEAFQEKNHLTVTGRFTSTDFATLKLAQSGLEWIPDPLEAKYVEILNGKQCYVRSKPNTTGDKLGVAHSGDRLEYIGTEENGWHKVKYGKKNAYVSYKYSRLAV